MFEREHVYPAYILRYFSIKIFLFRWLPYVLKHLEHINISQAIPLLSFFQEPSTITKFMGEIFEINSIEDIKDMDMNFTHVNPLKIISYIHHISQCTRGPFFHTTQPLTKTNPKRRSNSKTKTPKSTHELTTNHNYTILCHIGGLLRNHKSLKLTWKSSSPLPMSHHLPHSHLNNHLNKNISLHSLSPSYLKEKLQGLLTKSNQACTKYSPKCIHQFYMALIHGQNAQRGTFSHISLEDLSFLLSIPISSSLEHWNSSKTHQNINKI